MSEIIYGYSSLDVKKLEQQKFYVNKDEHKSANDFKLPSTQIICEYSKEKLPQEILSTSIKNIPSKLPIDDNRDRIISSALIKNLIIHTLKEEKYRDFTVLDLLNNDDFKKSYFLPEFLKRAVEKEFYCANKKEITNNPWDFIEQQIGKTNKSILLDIFVEKKHYCGNEIKEKAAEVSTHLSLTGTIFESEVLKHPNLFDFNASCLIMLNECRNKKIEEKKPTYKEEKPASTISGPKSSEQLCCDHKTQILAG